MPPSPDLPTEPGHELLGAGEEAFAEAAFRTGDFAEARRLLETAREVGSQHGDEALVAGATELIGMVLHYENITRLMRREEVSAADADAEEQMFGQALEMRRAVGDTSGSAASLFGLGLVAQVLGGDWAKAFPLFIQALEIIEEEGSGDLYTCSEVHRHLGFYFLVEDFRPAEAVHHLEVSLDLREELGDPRRIPSGLQALGEAELAAGNRTRALELLRAAVAGARAAGLMQERIESAEEALVTAEATT